MKPSVILAVLIGITALIVLSGCAGGSDADADKATAYMIEPEVRPWLYSLDKDALVRIEVSSAGHTVRYVKKPDTNDWYIQENNRGTPLLVPLTMWVGTPLLVSGPRVNSVLADNIDDPTSYGLDPPETKMLVAIRGGQSIEIHLGIPTPNEDNQYARLVGNPQLFTVAATWAQMITRLATDPPYPPHGAATPAPLQDQQTITQEAIRHIEAGLDALNQGQWEDALTELDAAIRIDPEQYLPYVFRGYANLTLERPALALQDYDEAIRLNPRSPDAYEGRGEVYLAQGSLERAIVDLDEAIRLNPDFARAYTLRGSANVLLGQYQIAVQDFDLAIGLGHSNLEEDYTGLCDAYTNLGEIRQALDYCNQALQLSPQFGQAHNNRCVIHMLLSQYDQALTDCDEAIRLNPDPVKAYGNRGSVYLFLGEYRRAHEDYDKAIDLIEEHDAMGLYRLPEPYIGRGMTNTLLGNTQAGNEDFDRAVTLGYPLDRLMRKRTELHLGIGVDKYEQGRLEDAITQYDRAIELDPNLALAYASRGAVYADLGQSEKAQADQDNACQLDTRYC